MNKNIQSADAAQVKKVGQRKESIDSYGTSFGKLLTSDELLKRCDEQLEKCEKWTANLTALKAEKEAEIKAQRIEALKTSVSTMSAEEKAEIINLLNA
jgi:hypothetical protein